MTGARAKPWVKHSPEQRLSVIFDQFLDRALIQPFYATAINDSDHGTRTDNGARTDRQTGKDNRASPYESTIAYRDFPCQSHSRSDVNEVTDHRVMPD
jgi:hypothetical protein